MKTNKLILSCLMLVSVIMCYGQKKFITKSGHVSFYSHTIIEDIHADNNQVLSIVDLSTGKVAAAILMKSFLFEKSLMQEHFNENYVETDQYPKAVFKGKIINLSAVKKGYSKAMIKGNITLHGISRNITITSDCVKKDGKIFLKGRFNLKPEDFDIKIPSVVKNNIAKVIRVAFDFSHEPFKRR